MNVHRFRGGQYNNGRHPTRISYSLKFEGSGGRVMPGVMLLLLGFGIIFDLYEKKEGATV